jgi:hypothetical protein
MMASRSRFDDDIDRGSTNMSTSSPLLGVIEAVKRPRGHIVKRLELLLL